MSSVKSRKMSLFVIRSIVAVTGVLMFAFQNCSRVDTLQVSDLAGKAIRTNEFIANDNADDNVAVQIETDAGNTFNVDSSGNETPVDTNNNNGSTTTTDNSNNNGGSGSSPGVQQPVDDHPVLVTEDDGIDEDNSDLDICVSEEQNHKYDDGGMVLNGKHHHDKDHDDKDHDDKDHDDKDHDDNDHHGKDHKEAKDEDHHKVSTTVASYQKIKCKKKERKHDGPRCMDLARQNGMNVIDLAKLDDVSVIKSLKGKTLIMTTDPVKSAAKALVIENSVGKTILCGVVISRLDIHKGNLEMREGAQVRSCGEVKGRIFKDSNSRIEGSYE